MTDYELKQLVAKAAAWYESLSPVDKALHDSDQRRSYVRGETGRDPGDILADEVRRLRAFVEFYEGVKESFDDTWQCPGCGHAEEWWTDCNADYATREARASIELQQKQKQKEVRNAINESAGPLGAGELPT